MFKIKFSPVDKEKIKQVLGIEEKEPYEIVLCPSNEEMEPDKINLVFKLEQLPDIASKIQFFTAVNKIYLTGKSENGEVKVALEDISYIESFGNDIFAYVNNKTIALPTKLYQLAEELEPFGFVRVGKSIIVNIAQIYAVKPILNGKLLLTLNDEKVLEVNRTYVHAFKAFLKK